MKIKTLVLLVLLVPALAWAKEQFQPVDETLLGIWRQIDVEDAEAETLELTSTQCAYVKDNQLQRVAPVLGQIGDQLVTNNYGRRSRLRVSLEGDTLTLSSQHPMTGESTARRYRLLATRPEAFDLKPLALGDKTRPLAPERIAELQAELANRRKLDQEVRQKMHTGEGTQEDIDRMKEIDSDNTSWLIELVSEIGWIDIDRFGRETAQSAFLIVQHSGQLPLMMAALPELEKEAKATGKGGSYALLFDRTQLRIGRKQRYGSQIGGGPDGMFVMPLEDPKNVDERRAEIDMQPLDDYLDFFRSQNDGKDIPIREKF